MKYLLIFIASFLLAFEVKFQDVYIINIFPNQKALMLETTKFLNINYTPKLYTNTGIILLNYDKADEFVRNNLYFDGTIKTVYIKIIDLNNIRYKIIKNIKTKYKKCSIKKIIFTSNLNKTLFFKPTKLKLNYTTILNCP